MADRFYCPDPPRAGRAVLEGDEARHLARVCRLVTGDAVEIFDGRGLGYRAVVGEVGKAIVTLTVFGDPIPERAPTLALTLATAVPKGERFDWLVEKATELGVARLVPLRTARSVVDPRASKLDRLRRGAIEAAKQCGRSRLPRLDEPAAWADFLAACPAATRLIAHPGGDPPADWPDLPAGASVALAIGPEGGFADAEVEAARAVGWRAISLGPTRLRVETAALAGLAAVLARCGGWTAC